MAFETIISCEEAARHLKESGWVFVDCRFQLADKSRGHQDYLARHVDGAVYADLDKDLSGEIFPRRTGRHPLPDKKDLAKTIGRLGISNGSQVVVYDDQAGQMAAARLWWLLKWSGHAAVAVLDGGFQLWNRLGLPVESGDRRNEAADFRPSFEDGLVVLADEVSEKMSVPEVALVDARNADRYRGENETIDFKAGHIPGAISAPFADNIAPDGKSKGKEELWQQFDAKVGKISPENTIFYCGSGVTAAQSVLAYSHCGKGMPRLYAGSWSDWINKEERPIATGE